MAFADFYFERFKTYNTQIPEIPVDKDLRLIVVIPSYREFKLFETLECLSKNDLTAKAEVIVVFNSKIGEDESIVEMHRLQAQRMERFNTENLRFIPVLETDLPPKIAGAGLARKLGMDLAVRRFNSIDNPGGIILSLDADTLCEKKYIQTVINEFDAHPKAPGATIAFEHPVEGDEFPREIYDAIVLYELYMRYYIQALRFTGFPYAYHTVGSAFAVRAWAYVKQGGMGLHQAGEDFYFLHKIIPLGGFFEIKSTKVFPSPRVSNRVVFGTGPAVRQIISEKKYDYPTYPLEAFLMLKPLFDTAERLFRDSYQDLITEPLLLEFLAENGFDAALEQMRKNSSGPETFVKRFYSWFDAFRVLKFLNYATSDGRLELAPVTQVARQLLTLIGREPAFNARDLLKTYRELQN